jgi:hypothetical protein
MRRAGAKMLSILDHKIGRCPRCMRTTFICAFAAWCAYLAVRLLWPASGLPAVVAILAIGLTTLWLAHTITFGTRLFRRLSNKYLNHPQPPTEHFDGITRRNLFWVLASTAATTAAVFFPSILARAQSPAGGHYCGNDPSTPNCGCDANDPLCCTPHQGSCGLVLCAEYEWLCPVSPEWKSFSTLADCTNYCQGYAECLHCT